MAAAEEALFTKEYEAQDERKREGCVGEDAERDVKREKRAVRGRRREAVGRREMGCQEKHQNEGQHERAHRELAMIQLKNQIRKRQEPAEERHRAVEIVIRDRMEA